MASIELIDVTRIFPNGRAAVQGLSLAVGDGELLVLLGPSGSGKSTALRLIAGLERPTTGRILIDGQDVTEIPPSDRDLAMVFQSYALYPHLSVRENMAFGLRVRRVARATIAARVHATAAALGLDALLDRRPAQLSGGERQRVALGRAIVREPRAFLLDEPLSNLDPLLRASTRAEIALLHRRLTATMVYVTHDQEEATTLGTRVVVMRAGAIEQVAAPLELFERPANAFVARFVGAPAMNVWSGVRVEAAQPRVVSPVGAFDLVGLTPTVPVGAEVLVGIRPHDIAIVPEADCDGRGQVEIVQPLGAATLIHVRVAQGSGELLRVVVPADVRMATGDRVPFKLRRDRLHLFDARTEKRLS